MVYHMMYHTVYLCTIQAVNQKVCSEEKRGRGSERRGKRGQRVTKQRQGDNATVASADSIRARRADGIFPECGRA